VPAKGKKVLLLKSIYWDVKEKMIFVVGGKEPLLGKGRAHAESTKQIVKLLESSEGTAALLEKRKRFTELYYSRGTKESNQRKESLF